MIYQEVPLHVSGPLAPVTRCASTLQLIEHKGTAKETKVLETETEAMLGLHFVHPNVVRTYKYTTRQMTAVRCTNGNASHDHVFKVET